MYNSIGTIYEGGGRLTAKRTKKHRLLLQVVAIVLPLFLLMSAVICQQVYTSSVDSYLEALNADVQKHLDTAYWIFDINEDIKPNDELLEWYLYHLENDPAEMRTELTEEEQKRLTEAYDTYDVVRPDWVSIIPEDIRLIYTRYVLSIIHNGIQLIDNVLSNRYERIFIIDVTEGYQGMVILDSGKDGENMELGSYYDIDFKNHPAIQQLIDDSSLEYTFERTGAPPFGGSKYIGCKPIVAHGKTRAVIGIIYNWETLHNSLLHTMIKNMLISVVGILIVMTVLLIFLYHRAIRPVGKIEKALTEYTKDKSSAKIVAKMLEAYVGNEIGYLSDVISDLALEIDCYMQEVARSEKELYEARVQIMVSQINPHFMYNTLSSIAMLCEIDPDVAQEMTITFAKYLRENMDSLKQTKPVPFDKELEHLKKYLYIEKIRFDDRLNVEYDIQATDFELPQLSIQPLVENSVKHGIGKKEDGGTVTIATRETDTAFEVIISDDGVGFDVNAPQKDDGRSHIGMENIRKRLKDMCDADIIIESEIGKGTTSKVIIPKHKKEDMEQ